MTPRQAAAVIGCDVSQVRRLISSGALLAKRRKMPGGYYYDIKPQDVRRYANTPQTSGYPRGQKRKAE